MSELWRLSQYLTPEIYTSGRIVEYDLKSANINALADSGVIDNSYYEYLSRLPKESREVEIGLLIKDKGKEFYDIIQSKITSARQHLIEDNQVDDTEIVRIANDAVYINKSYNLKLTKFGKYLEFRIKSESFCMLNLDRNLQIFFKYIGDDVDVDIKGISEDKIYLHSNILSFIGGLVYRLQRVGFQDAIIFYNDFYKEFINRNLPIEYYREFNSVSCYNVYGMYLSTLDESAKNFVDINCNLLLLRNLWKMLLGLYR